MNTSKKDFDKEAASWDEKAERVKLANDVACAVRTSLPLSPDMHVLDFGCGTGLVTLRLQPYVRSVTGVDSSHGMLGALTVKIQREMLANVRALRVDLDAGDTIPGKYHLIVSSMTLHHVREIEPLLALFHSITVPGGYLAIGDLDSEGGRFHSSNEGVFHFGFDREKLRAAMMQAGFEDVRDKTAAEMVKPDAEGALRRFSVFLMTGRRKMQS